MFQSQKTDKNVCERVISEASVYQSKKYESNGASRLISFSLIVEYHKKFRKEI